MARRLEPTVLLAAISPITVALVAGAVALTLLLSGSLIAAIVVGIAVYVLRVLVSRLIASRVAALPRRIDPFALREPWRFFVRDAIRAQTRFTDALTDTEPGPLRDVSCVGRVLSGPDFASGMIDFLPWYPRWCIQARAALRGGALTGPLYSTAEYRISIIISHTHRYLASLLTLVADEQVGISLRTRKNIFGLSEKSSIV